MNGGECQCAILCILINSAEKEKRLRLHRIKPALIQGKPLQQCCLYLSAAEKVWISSVCDTRCLGVRFNYFSLFDVQFCSATICKFFWEGSPPPLPPSPFTQVPGTGRCGTLLNLPVFFSSSCGWSPPRFRRHDFLPLFSSLSCPLPCGSFKRRLSLSELFS